MTPYESHSKLKVIEDRLRRVQDLRDRADSLEAEACRLMRDVYHGNRPHYDAECARIPFGPFVYTVTRRGVKPDFTFQLTHEVAPND